MPVVGILLARSASSVLAGCGRRLLVVSLFSAVLLWPETEAEKGFTAGISLNKPVWSSDLILEAWVYANHSGSAASSLFFNHRGDGEEQGDDVLCRFAWQGYQAAFFWSYSVEDMRRQRQSCLSILWPVSGPPLPQSSGSSTSRPQANSEALQLRSKVHQRCCTKWFVPGDGITAPTVELVMEMRWRTQGTRSLFRFLCEVLVVKVRVPFVIFFSAWTQL
jgi:hypothetical protein